MVKHCRRHDPVVEERGDTFLSSKEEEEALYSVVKSRRRRDSVVEDTNETLGEQAMPVEKIRLDRHVA